MRALGALAEQPAPEHVRLAELVGLPPPPEPDEFTAVLVLDVHPYASVYLSSTGMRGGDPQARIEGFWRALGLEAPEEPDHVSSLLGLLAHLSEAEAAEADAARRSMWRHAGAALGFEHLVPWIGPFCGALERTGSEFYRAWARTLLRALTGAAETLGGGAHEGLPVHLEDAPELEDPRRTGREAADTGSFVAQLLAPVRSGVVITRSDLRHGGRVLGLGVRIGERRFTLEALLQQDGPRTLEWLAEGAGEWAGAHGYRAGPEGSERPGPPEALAPVSVRTFWEDRADRTRELLRNLSEDATR